MKIKILLIIFLPFKKQNALRARLRPLKASGCPDSPSIVPEVGCRALIALVSYVEWLLGAEGASVSLTGQGVSRTGGLIPGPASRTGGLASWELDEHGAIETQTLVGYVCMRVSKSVVDGRGV